jgi:cytochrome-b5 reductase
MKDQSPALRAAESFTAKVMAASLAAADLGITAVGGSIADMAPAHTGLSPERFTSLTIREVTSLSPDTKAFDILLPHGHDVTGLITSSFVMVRGADEEAKPYTPVSPCDQRGWFRLVVKSYPGGAVSQHLHSLAAGDCMLVKGPFMKLEYAANKNKSIGLIAAGTGITPMLQIIREVIKNPADTTKMSLLYQCRYEADIALLKGDIDELAAQHASLSVTYILSQPGAEWTGLRGRMDAAVLASSMPPPPSAPGADGAAAGDVPLIYVCGPAGMLESLAGPKTADKSQGELQGLLRAAGYTADMVYKV